MSDTDHPAAVEGDSVGGRDAAEPAGPRAGTRSPRRSRERALKVLFQADLRGESPLAALARVVADPADLALLDDLDAGAGDGPTTADGTLPGDTVDPEPLDGFARALVEGVSDHRDEIDRLISQFARKWSIPRMPVVDRNVLRLATYELLYDTTPAAIVIDEAVELAKALSTDNSAGYVNGVVDAIRRSLDRH